MGDLWNGARKEQEKTKNFSPTQILNSRFFLGTYAHFAKRRNEKRDNLFYLSSMWSLEILFKF
jgi:hypothetical protein